LFSVVFTVLVHQGVAFANFLLLIPNGMQAGASPSGGWHAWGHTRDLPDPSMLHVPFRRNSFGRDFFTAGHRWTRALCKADSDGDGRSNGEELGDPDCIWQVGQTPTRISNITHPGRPDCPGQQPSTCFPYLAESDLPPAFNVTGAGFTPANGVYALVTMYPEAYTWHKPSDTEYIWRHMTEDCTLWIETGWTGGWGISCYGDHVYMGGGDGKVPTELPVVRSGLEAWERGKAPAPQLKPLQANVAAPPPPSLPQGAPYAALAFYFQNVAMPSFVLLAAALAWRCAWLPRVHWGLVVGMWAWLWAGVSIGNHRLFSHRSFTAGFLAKNTLALAACMSMQDSPIRWASMHRTHHEACEQYIDPHSPVVSDRGFWFAHASWAATPREHAPTWSPARTHDLLFDPDLWWLPYGTGANMFLLYVVGSLIAATYVTARHERGRRSLRRLLMLAMYNLGVYVMLPVTVVWNSTMLINSATHIWGERPYMDGSSPHTDSCESHNVVWLFPLLFGENWHNNHHAAPGSASTWVHWYQVDLVYATVHAMAALGLVWDVRVELPLATRPGYEEGSAEMLMMLAQGCGVAALFAWKVQRWLHRGRESDPKRIL